MSRARLYSAALVAIILGLPLTEKALAQDWWDIFNSAAGLGFSIANASEGS